jgi:transposase
MGDLFWLTEAWTAIEPHLPKNQPGARRVDGRRVISGILNVLNSGCRWRDCPLGVWTPHHDLQSLQSLVATTYLAANLRSARRDGMD